MGRAYFSSPRIKRRKIMALIPEMKLMDFQDLCENDVRKMESVVLTDVDGKYLATILVPQTDYIKTQAEYMGELSNGVRPKN
jgi:hypothetical protein